MLATFQAYINKIMWGILNKFCVIYLDDILIYLQTEEEYEQYIKEVLQCLNSANLYTKLLKYKFYKTEVKFLGFLVGWEGVWVDPI